MKIVTQTKTQKLRELAIGDRFIPCRDKKKTVYRVEGKPEFNSGHGTSTRQCSNMGLLYSKSCNLDVIKI